MGLAVGASVGKSSVWIAPCRRLIAVTSKQQIAMPADCAQCPHRAACLLGQPLPEEQGDCAGIVQRQLQVDAGTALFHRAAPFRSLFVVCAGAVKTQRVTSAGDLVVTGFCLPGDIVGLEALGSSAHEYDAVATAPTRVVRFDVERLLRLCSHKPALYGWVMGRIGHLLRRKDVDQGWAKGLPTDERILRFFLDLHERMRPGSAGHAIEGELPMRKQDIAHYLNITPETLSRNLTVLRRKRLLLIQRSRYALPNVEQARMITRL
jgi:CRP/FNR family transcriptional regulator